VICHRQHVFQKLNLHGVADLILYAIRKGVISAHGEALADNG
jgi:DNA-binding CsgD family transcriptional regulator